MHQLHGSSCRHLVNASSNAFTNFDDQQSWVDDWYGRLAYLTHPRRRRCVVDVLWHKPTDPDTGIGDDHSSRRSSRITVVVSIGGRSCAPISAASCSMACKTARA